jgi:hypothetical protein
VLQAAVLRDFPNVDDGNIATIERIERADVRHHQRQPSGDF